MLCHLVPIYTGMLSHRYSVMHSAYQSEIAAGGIVAFQTHSFLLLSNSVSSEFVLYPACE